MQAHEIQQPKTPAPQTPLPQPTSRPGGRNSTARVPPHMYAQEEAGFEGEYDFFYLPMDTHNKTNVGYAFINFTHPDSMQRFIQTFFGYRFKDHSSHKIAKVSTAHLQGFWSNVQHFSNRAVTHARNSQYRPIVVIDGQRMDMSEVVSRLLAEEYASWWHLCASTMFSPALAEIGRESTSLARIWQDLPRA